MLQPSSLPTEQPSDHSRRGLARRAPAVVEAREHGRSPPDRMMRRQRSGGRLGTRTLNQRLGETMSATSTTPDTIVLIHGFWVTPRSWEHWIERYEQAGYRVIAPAYPGFEVEVEALNADTSPIAALTVPAVVEHLEAVVGDFESPPILIGHSAGGDLRATPPRPRVRRRGGGHQLRSDRKTVRVTPPSQIKSLFPCPQTQPTATAPSASRPSSGTTCSRTLTAKMSPRRCTSTARVSGLGGDPVGDRAGQPGTWPPGHVGRLQE